MITIGLPFFNAEKTLADAIRSVFAQTLEDWELIMVDDGSTDNSLRIARSVLDTRVRVIRGNENLGLSTRLNQIAHTAGGEYLARLDADDMLHPERLARQVSVLESQLQVDLVGTAMYSLDRENRPRGLHQIRPPVRLPIDLLRTSLVNHATVTGRTVWFKNNPYDPTFLRSEDHELWIRTHRTLSMVQLAEPLYYCREEQSMNVNKYLRSCECNRRIFRQYGPNLVGKSGTASLCVRSFLKGSVQRLFALAKAETYLIHKRVPALSHKQVVDATEHLERIARTAVPGLVTDAS